MLDWRFLDDWEQLMLGSFAGPEGLWDPGPARLLRENRRARFDPATPHDVKATEQRLSLALPPDVKDFYLRTNGWLDVDWVDRVLQIVPVDEIEWLKDVSPETIRNWQVVPDEASDRNYFDYSATQGLSFRSRYLTDCLLISRIEDEEGGLYLLNTAVKDSEGHFEAWYLYHKLPGANRWPSFHSMMSARWRSARLGRK